MLSRMVRALSRLSLTARSVAALEHCFTRFAARVISSRQRRTVSASLPGTCFSNRLTGDKDHRLLAPAGWRVGVRHSVGHGKLTSMLLRVGAEQDLNQLLEVLDQNVAQLCNSMTKVQRVRKTFACLNSADEPCGDIFQCVEDGSAGLQP